MNRIAILFMTFAWPAQAKYIIAVPASRGDIPPEAANTMAIILITPLVFCAIALWWSRK